MKAGDTIPTLERTIALADMIAYAGATWDWHPLHYDLDFLKTIGLDAPVVDGQVFGALIAEQLQDWLGPRCFVRTLAFRFRSMVFAGETVRVVGAVTATRDGALETEHQVLVGERLCVTGTAEVLVTEVT